MLKSIIGFALLASAAAVQGNPSHGQNMNKTIKDLCLEMYSSSGAEQLNLADQILADAATNTGPLSTYDEQCIGAANDVVQYGYIPYL